MAQQTREEYVRSLTGEARVEAMRAATAQIDQLVLQQAWDRKEAARAVYQQVGDWGAQSPNQETDKSAAGQAAGAPTDAGRTTSFSITSFRTELAAADMLPKHSFLVSFSPFDSTQLASKVLNRYIINGSRSMTLRCDSAILPGATALTEDVRRFGYGPIEPVTYGMQFGDFTLSFMLDSKGNAVKFFNEWMSLTTNYASKGGGNMMNEQFGMKAYEVGYKDDYSNLQMNITVYDRQYQQTLIYEIYDVFPTSINAVDVSWGDTDQMMRLYVRFAFTDYTVKVPGAQSFAVPSVDESTDVGRRERFAGEIVVSGLPARNGLAIDFGGSQGVNAQNPTSIENKDRINVSTDPGLLTYIKTRSGTTFTTLQNTPAVIENTSVTNVKPIT